MLQYILGVVALIIGLAVGYAVSNKLSAANRSKLKNDFKKEKENFEQLKKSAEAKAKEIIVEAKEEAHKTIKDGEREAKERRIELSRSEKRIQQREDVLHRREESVSRKEQDIRNIEQSILKKEQNLKQNIDLQLKKLQNISKMTVEEAKEMLLKTVEREVKMDAAKLIKEVETQAKEEAYRRAREIAVLAMQRCAVEDVAEVAVSVVPLPSDEMKGRLIGREGRNIRAFEMLTGVDLIVDDTPEAVLVSCFDPIRREIGRLTLEKLIQDGRIHPARIEEIVQKATEEVEAKIKTAGEDAVLECGVSGLHPELIKILVKLYFRTSYGQNVLQNSVEASAIAGIIANEVDADVALAKRAALLHDIGKTATFEVDGSHALIGADIARKFREPKGVIHAIAAHHEDEEPTTLEAIIVQIGDAISAARPGARGDTYEAYIKRLRKLEEIAESFPGVEKTYAIQAGREIRVIVKPEEMQDELLPALARDIAKKVEEGLQYPGQIRVTLIRETRVVEYAK